jgi:hypothetical protein
MPTSPSDPQFERNLRFAVVCTDATHDCSDRRQAAEFNPEPLQDTHPSPPDNIHENLQVFPSALVAQSQL